MKTFIVSFICILFLCSPVCAKKSFSTKELKEMISNGDYPAFGAPETIRDEKLDFSQCLVKVKAILFTIQGTYPIETLEETKETYVVNAWLNDGLTKWSCSTKDKQLKMTSAPYEE